MSCIVILCRKRRPELELDAGGDQTAAPVAAASISIQAAQPEWKAAIEFHKHKLQYLKEEEDKNPSSRAVTEKWSSSSMSVLFQQCLCDLVPLWNKNVPLQSQFNPNLFSNEPYFLFNVTIFKLIQNVVKQSQTSLVHHSTASSFFSLLYEKCCTAKPLLWACPALSLAASVETRFGKSLSCVLNCTIGVQTCLTFIENQFLWFLHSSSASSVEEHLMGIWHICATCFNKSWFNMWFNLELGLSGKLSLNWA